MTGTKTAFLCVCVCVCVVKAYTIEGDQIMNGRFYAYKRRPLGVIKESVDRAIQ